MDCLTVDLDYFYCFSFCVQSSPLCLDQSRLHQVVISCIICRMSPCLCSCMYFCITCSLWICRNVGWSVCWTVKSHEKASDVFVEITEVNIDFVRSNIRL